MSTPGLGSPLSPMHRGSPAHLSSDPPHAEDLDIVVSTADASLAFLKAWAPVLSGFQVTVLYFGPDSELASLKPPSGLRCQVYSRHDIKKTLGQNAACISRDSACRCFGWLVSKKPLILTFSDDTLPLTEDSLLRSLRNSVLPPRALPTSASPLGAVQDANLNPLTRHTRNLGMPSNPLHFNTLYDPFEPGTDFVRGYPFSLREGMPTAVSHGLWLNLPDYDAPTQLVKPNERNLRYVDATQTIPKGVLFPMSALNLAFNRELVGAAMYFPPILESQGMGFHDDMWAGWCCKVICDHLGLGVKSGIPYVWRARKGSAFASLKKEYKGIFWQEEIVPFFQSLHLPPEASSAEACYLEIAKQVKEKLGKVDPTFVKLADGMTVWVDVWRAFNP